VGAQPRVFDLESAPDTEALGDCELAVIFVCPDGTGGTWLSMVAEGSPVPPVLVGERDHLLALSPAVQAAARGFLMDWWQPDEALVRMTLAIPRQQGAMAATRHHSPAPEGHIRVVAADDDPTALSLVGLALENFGMDCERACDGPSALEAVRRTRPHAVVLDINMPGMNGYEVLTAIRAERLPVRVLLLTARQQERDIIRGFSLGADDYVVKPFSPLELVARLKRLLAK
jgi:CheY-like chemotaxis protein